MSPFPSYRRSSVYTIRFVGSVCSGSRCDQLVPTQCRTVSHGAITRWHTVPRCHHTVPNGATTRCQAAPPHGASRCHQTVPHGANRCHTVSNSAKRCLTVPHVATRCHSVRGSALFFFARPAPSPRRKRSLCRCCARSSIPDSILSKSSLVGGTRLGQVFLSLLLYGVARLALLPMVLGVLSDCLCFVRCCRPWFL